MQYRITISLVLLICAAIALAGCTGTQSTPVSPSTTGSGTGSPATPVGNMVVSPTDAVPSDYSVTIDIGEKDYLGNIPVIFQGGMGQAHVTKIDVTLTRSDGVVKTAVLGIKKGDEVEFEGTKQTDRVEVWVSMNDGHRYKTNDVLSPYRTRP